MNSFARVTAEAGAAWRSFLRRRTAVFFTFGFPLILVAIFGGVVRTAGSEGLFAHPPGFYVPGYLAILVVFTPLTRIGSSVARYRASRRFEKLTTTPQRRGEWLVAHTAINTGIILLAALVVLGLLGLLTGARIRPSPYLLPFLVLGVALFCGVGAVLGRVADSRDGVVAASNAIALPLVFLSETFVTADLLPGWAERVVALSPLTYFARGVRAATYTGRDPLPALLILLGLTAVCFAAGVYAVPRSR